MKIRFAVTVILILIVSCTISCKKNHYKINAALINVNTEIKRFEKELFTLNPDEINALLPALKQNYSGFLQLFSYVINAGDINDTSFGEFLVRFCTDRQNNEIYTLTIKLYPDVSEIEKDINKAFSRYLYYFPGRKVPAVFTCITGFNSSIITGDSVLGISLDRYLGAECEYYKRLNIYKYISGRMTPENIVPDCIFGWGVSEWDLSAIDYAVDNVLTEMIHYGKIKYFEKCLLPDIEDEILFGFSPEQMKFCINNESQMWNYLIENDLLFSSDQFTIRKLTGEAPFTSYFTKESPGKAAIWLGFRIVESYMMRNPDRNLEEVMMTNDIQGILEKAKYNPQ